MVRIFKETNINFLGKRRIAYMFSGVLLAVTLISVLVHGLVMKVGFVNLSIEFTGGTMVQLKFDKAIEKDLGKVRTIVSGLGLGTPEIKTIGVSDSNEIQIIVKKQAEGTYVGDEIKEGLRKGYAENSFILRTEQKVGPKIGKELTWNALLAVMLSLVAIILYVWIRFNLPYGVAGVVGIFHDVFITFGFFSLTNREISLSTIAAMLTIMGYSINDTIVIFDRVRENLGGRLSGKSLEDVMNKSVNQTLSRTLITTCTVVFVLLAFTFFGGDVIRDFALAMLIGCLSGVYSTVFIASPIVMTWHKRWPMK